VATQPADSAVFVEIGRRIRVVRIALGFNSQAAFAKWLGGFTITRMSRAERGANPPPSELLYALAMRGINVNYILTGKGTLKQETPRDE